MREKVENFMNEDWNTTEKVLLLLCTLLTGVIIGFIISPVKGGIGLFSHNAIGSNNHDNGNGNSSVRGKKPQEEKR